MTKKGSQLHFISQIKNDGSGTLQVPEERMQHMHDTLFTINLLSLPEGTYIATNGHSFVVKLKPTIQS